MLIFYFNCTIFILIKKTNPVVETTVGRKDPVHGLPRDPRPGSVLLLVVVVRVGGPQRLHLGLLPLTLQENM